MSKKQASTANRKDSEPSTLRNVSTTLAEMIYDTERMVKLFQYRSATTWQQIRGEERSCCSMCGFCPDVLLQELKRMRDIIEQIRTKITEGKNDA